MLANLHVFTRILVFVLIMKSNAALGGGTRLGLLVEQSNAESFPGARSSSD